MLDLVHLPSDLFQLFVMSGFITGKFNSIAAVMKLFVLTILTAALFHKCLKLRVIKPC
ncbi:Sodium:dicarboxylate symporter family/bacterial extracellular solute-binding family 3 protein (fragment) [Shewanella benthica]|uniref:Sodium:dicarboxylate symporter family/bacterial extracellular solute-binding family 3 protein n=1 Tax=Shewanella benthica TaxID=43661 RepID=A0A330MAQ3_9GAMM